VRDPRVAFAAVSGGFGVLSGLFLAALVGRLSWLPLMVLVLSALLVANAGGGPLRAPLLAAQALVLGLLSLPLMLNGSGVVLLIGCLFAVAALFYRPPAPGAEAPLWLRETRRRRGRGDGGARPAERAD
jgi:hypothetical protein